MASPSASRLLALPASLRTMAWRQASIFAARPSTASRSISTTSRSISTTSPSYNEASPQSSVNQTEVTHFTNLASSWWDPHGSSRLLHLMNPLRHDFINRCLSGTASWSAQNAQQKLRYLDIGCGGGIFAESAARLPSTASVTAIDPTPECIAVAKQHQRQDPTLLEDGRLVYLNTAIEGLSQQLQQKQQQYDVISLFEVIEHIQSPAPFLETCLQHLKPGGWLIGSTIARSNVSWLTTKLIAEDLLRIVPRGTHEWSQYIQPSELKNWAQGRHELEIGPGGAGWAVMGVLYVPGIGWREVTGSEEWGNYFFGVRKRDDAAVD